MVEPPMKVSKQYLLSINQSIDTVHEMGAQMRKIMEAAGQEMPESKPTMEINVDHPLLKRLDQEADEDRFADLAQILLDQAFLA